MQEMIESEPALAERIVAGADGAAAALAVLARGEGAAAVVGCGTSEHASLGVAEMLREAGVAAARGRVRGVASPCAAAPSGGSHEGGTWATVRRSGGPAAGSATGLITARRPRAAAPTRARHAASDRSWCHTVGYVSPLCAGLALPAAVGAPAGPPRPGGRGGRARVRGRGRAAAATCTAPPAPDGRRRRRPDGARELALKIEEACRLPTAMRDMESSCTATARDEARHRAGARRCATAAPGDTADARARMMLQACARSACPARRSRPAPT